MLYYFTEDKYGCVILGCAANYAILSTDYNTCRAVCFLFTFYFLTISNLVYLLCKTSVYYKFLVKLLGKEFIIEHLKMHTTIKQLIKATTLCAVPVVIEMTTHFLSDVKTDRNIEGKTVLYERVYSLDSLSWGKETKKEYLRSCAKNIDDNFGGILTKASQAQDMRVAPPTKTTLESVRDFIRGGDKK